MHTATAPNPVLHTLPALPAGLWEPRLTAVWAVSAAIFDSYAPPQADPASPWPAAATGPDAVADMLDRAVDHGDEHVIKFTDTAAEVYTRTGHRGALAAALHAQPQDWPAARVSAIKAPTMLVVADNDIVRLEHAVEMFHLLGGGIAGDIHGLPASRLAVVPGTTHAGLCDRAQCVVPMIVEFLDDERASG